MTFSDTSLKAREVYFQRLKGMTSSERLGLGAALWNAGHSVQRAAVLRTNPDADADADEAEIAFRLAVTRFGSELARKAYRKQNVPSGRVLSRCAPHSNKRNSVRNRRLLGEYCVWRASVYK